MRPHVHPLLPPVHLDTTSRRGDDWRARAACATAAGLAAHEAAIDSDDPGIIDTARSYCDTCDVAQRCLAEHLTEPHGVYGGHDRHQRAALTAGAPTLDPPPVVGPCTTCHRPMMTPGAYTQAPRVLQILWHAQGYRSAHDRNRGDRHGICTSCAWHRQRRARQEAS